MIHHVVTVSGADPARDLAVLQLARDLEATPDHYVCIHDDPERRGVTWNWASALGCASRDPDREPWTTIIQDDMAGYPGWVDHLVEACRRSPRPVLGLNWIGDRWAYAARDHGVPFLVGRYVLRGGAVAYHRSTLASDLLPAFARRCADVGWPHDDLAAALWCQQYAPRPFLPALTSRSLFESLPTRSLLGHAVYPTATATIANIPLSWASRPSTVRTTLGHDNDASGRDLAARLEAA